MSRIRSASHQAPCRKAIDLLGDRTCRDQERLKDVGRPQHVAIVRAPQCQEHPHIVGTEIVLGTAAFIEIVLNDLGQAKHSDGEVQRGQLQLRSLMGPLFECGTDVGALFWSAATHECSH